MGLWLATNTMKAVVDAINADGGNSFRLWEGRVIPHLGDAYRADEDSFRSHLGASVIGGPCDRALWYSWRWAHKGKPTGKAKEADDAGYARMVRLWNRGHLEEGRFIALLLMIGVQVYQQDEKGNQFRVSFFGGHMGGSGDGVLLGVPDVPPGVPCLGEFKTHSDESFKELVEKGVRLAKPEHYVQMQIYLRGMGLVYALYVAVNKNTDELHMEIVQYDGETDARFLERGRRIIFSMTAQPRMRSASPTFWKCKYGCDMAPVCWQTVQPARNCRTCQFVEFNEDGSVRCTNETQHEIRNWPGVVPLDKPAQLAGCELYQLAQVFKEG